MSWVRSIKGVFINKSKVYDGNGLAPDVIRAMYLMAKMKDLATEGDIGFAGYFIDKNDRYYFVTNIEGMNDD